MTAHANPDGLAAVLDMLDRQTRPPDEVLVYVSDMDWPGAVVRPNLSDWGHDKRACGLADATGDRVGFFNDDDDYDPTYLETLSAVDADVVACDFRHKSGRVIETAPQVGRVSSGNFLTRTELARRVGWTGRGYEADGEFIVGLMAAGARWVRVPQTLYFHR